jgi:hypothetical protein
MNLTEDQLKDKHGSVTQQLQKQLYQKDKILNEYVDAHGKLELFFAQVCDTLQSFPSPEILYEPISNVNVESECTAVMHISDTHMGSVQEADEIEGFNEYNPDICENRCMDYAKKTIEWVQLHRLAYSIPTLSVIVTGDLISNDIHLELTATNAFPAPVQVVVAGNLLARQLMYVAPHFERVDVHFLVADNHSRLTKKPQAKEEGYNSLNYIVGMIAQCYLKDVKNIVFNIYPQYEKVVSVLNRNYLIMHGHNIRGWMGIPWYSIERKIAKEATTRMGLMLDEYFNKRNEIGFHKLVMGHFHTPMDHPLYTCSGSVQGTDAYDHKDGRYAKPSQSAWMVHPKWGEFDKINFIL